MKSLKLLLLFLIPVVSLAQYRPMNQKYEFRDNVKFLDTVFLDTGMAGQGVYLVLDTLTGEVKRDTVSSGSSLTSDSILTIVRANVDTSGTLNLQQVTDNGATTTNEISLSSLQATGSGGITLQNSGGTSVFTIGSGGGTNGTMSGNLSMNNNRILSVNNPVLDKDALNKRYFRDNIIRTDTFLLTSSELQALVGGKDSLLSGGSADTIIDVVSITAIRKGDGFLGSNIDSVYIGSENGIISLIDTNTVVGNIPGLLYEKQEVQDQALLGRYIRFSIVGTTLGTGNNTLRLIFYYRKVYVGN